MSNSVVTVGLFVRLEAQSGKQEELARFLASAVPIVEAEPDTAAWFAVRLGSASFAIFDVFATAGGRDAHLAGRLAAALTERASELLAAAPEIVELDVLASTGVA